MTRGIIPALAHWMQHPDTLAQEFDAILNLSETFPVFQPLDPALTFFTPLRNNTRDIRGSSDSFLRSSDAWYRDGSGIYRKLGTDQPAFEANRLRMEAAKTNLVQIWNADPNIAVGWSGSGYPAGLSIVNNPGLLSDAGLQDMVPSGNVYRAEGGAGNLIADGGTLNTNVHYVSAWCYCPAGSTGFIQLEGSPGDRVHVIGPTAGLVHFGGPQIPAAVDRRWFCSCETGEMFFILSQLEESPAMTSPIITEGTAGQRAIDKLEYSQADQFINQTEGTVLLTWVPEFENGDVPNDTRFEFMGLPDRVADRWGYFFKDGTGLDHFIFLPATGASAFVAFPAPVQKGKEYKIAYRYGAGFNDSGFFDDAVTWGPTNRAYTATNPGTTLAIVAEPFTAQRIANIQIYDEKKSRAWIEENYFQPSPPPEPGEPPVIDPAIVFSAPLHENLDDAQGSQSNFARGSDAWVLDDNSIYRRVGDDIPRFQNQKLLMEPAITNKCVSYNANPDPGLTGIGGTGGNVSIVSRPDLIVAAGLQDICSDNNVIELDNSGGGADADIIFHGLANNTEHHTFSLWAHRIFQAGTGDEVRLGLTGGVAGSVAITTEWKRYIFRTFENQAPVPTSEGRIVVEPGFGVQCVLQQMEENRFASSPITTEGTAGQRAADSLNYSDPDSWFNQVEGMVFITLVPICEIAETQPERSALAISTATPNLIYYRPNEWRSYDSNSIIGVPLASPSINVTHIVCTRWGPSGFQIGVNRSPQGWVWSVEDTYVGPFHSTNALHILRNLVLAFSISDIVAYDEDRGVDWIEANYP